MDYQECTSECESGWTLYLETTSISSYEFIIDGNEVAKISLNEDEDLSMMSDASSGPPHLHEEEEDGGYNATFYHYPVNNDDPLSKNSKKKNNEERRRNFKDHSSSLLDDTASSPFFDFSDKRFSLTRSLQENVVEYSQGYSSTLFEVRPPDEEQYDIFQSKQSGNQLQQNKWFEGKNGVMQ